MALAAAALAASCATAPSMEGSSDARSLAAAETAFAAQSVREDMRAAFLAHFARDGVLVRRGGWMTAREALESQPAPRIVLDWRPVYTQVAASGELGLSTGPWTITRKDDPAAAPLHGQFVSIWRRDADNVWRVLVDLGIDHPQPALEDARLVAAPPTGFSAPEGDDVAAAEAAFQFDAILIGPRDAYAKYASPGFRFYRQGVEPMVGKDVALAWSPETAALRVVWRVDKAETARSRDFGYARGSYGGPDDNQPRGFFLRVWRREADGWRIALAVSNPIPQ